VFVDAREQQQPGAHHGEPAGDHEARCHALRELARERPDQQQHEDPRQQRGSGLDFGLPEHVLEVQRRVESVMPRRALDNGYTFRFPELGRRLGPCSASDRPVPG
jgi:hypothetical protein